MHILMVAAENDALPGGKVGGIGDVVRDVPPALAAQGHTVTVVTPAYGVFAEFPESRRMTALDVGFGGSGQHIELYEVPGKQPQPGISHVVLDHPLFEIGGRGVIYCNDPPQRPFASDASKFALFCTAVAEAVVRNVFGPVDVLHLHDWHAAFVLILRRFHPAYRDLAQLRCVYTIHNLALQGIRPFAGDVSSLHNWYPGLHYDPAVVADPRWPDCVNPMAAGIRLADAVHTVSPSYAEEILQPSEVAARGYYGGEGLQTDLQRAQAQGRLHGILNGCEYPKQTSPPAADWPAVQQLLRAQLINWIGANTTIASAHFLAYVRVSEWTSERPPFVLTSIGRITEQKVRLLGQSSGSDGRPALDRLLETLAQQNGILLMLGSGDVVYEQFLTAAAARHSNFVFLRGYSDAISQMLYTSGDLFLMPSSFEPCGISQMLSMRAGQPCLVHHVGGLRDTVADGTSGFAFTGSNLSEQADAMVTALQTALQVRFGQPQRWRAISKAAAAARFLWSDSIRLYIEHLYR
jgi:starch synthase